MIRRLFQDINLRNKTTADAVIRHLLQANGGVTKLFEPCCAVDNEVKQRVQDLAAVLQDHAKTDQASNVILEQDAKLTIVSSWLALKALCLSQERLPLCEDDVELLCNAYNIALMKLVKPGLGTMQRLLRHPAETTVSCKSNKNTTKNTVLAVCHWEGKKKIMAAALEEQTCSQSVLTKYTTLPF